MPGSKTSTRWATLIGSVLFLGIALVGAYVLALVTTGWLGEQHFVWLFWVNVAVAALLLLVLALALARLVRRLRARHFGSRLLAKLAGIFALVGMVPGLLIYAVSYQFVSRSVDSWFDVQVASALDAGLVLGRSTFDAMAADLAQKNHNATLWLAEQRGNAPSVTPALLERMREQMGVASLSIVGADGQALQAAGSSMAPGAPDATLLRQGRMPNGAAVVEGLDDEPAPGERPTARVRALALLPGNAIGPVGVQDERWLMSVQPVPPTLLANALAVQAAYREYQQRALTRDNLRRMYVGTLTLALVLAVFGAVLLAIMLGHQIARPLLLLADGVRQVAAGDLTAKPVFASGDELGGLTRSFAQMTGQLADARAEVQRGVAQLEGARTRLQTILDNLSAGVLVLDRDGRIDTANPGATRILRQPIAAWLGRRLTEVAQIHDFGAAVWQRSELHRQSPEAGERDHWQDAFELRTDDQGSRNLLLRGALLPGGARLVVFDDITEVVSAQRSLAWGEVARRVAHEIKNPLTPIQLSAERIEHKLAPKLDDAGRSMLTRSVATIVNQVQAMKRLVDDFRDYARLPAAQLLPVDLNALVREVLGLYAAQQESGRLRAGLASALPQIDGDASQLRQVVHNLVQNALDAVADIDTGLVEVSTEAVPDDRGVLRAVRLNVADNGTGFAEQVLRRAFEPYVTTKAKGTGLGLAVVKKIADEHGARVRLANRPPLVEGAAAAGAEVSLSFSRFSQVQSASVDDRAAPALRPPTAEHPGAGST